MKVKKNLDDSSVSIAIKADPDIIMKIDYLRRHQKQDIPSRAQMFIRLLETAYKESTSEAA